MRFFKISNIPKFATEILKHFREFLIREKKNFVLGTLLDGKVGTPFLNKLESLIILSHALFKKLDFIFLLNFL